MVDALRTAAAANPGAGEIFQILRDGTARTKAELATITGLARSTVALRVDALLAADLLRPAGEAVSTGGRPPARLAFNSRAGVVLAVDLGATHATSAVADLAGVILDSRTRTIDIGDGPESLLDLILDDAGALLEASRAAGIPLLGVGIGVPGPVEHSTGRPTNPPIMPGWDRFDIPAYVQRTFDVPVLVDNDVNILALGEQATTWPHVDDLVFVKVSTGIGCTAERTPSSNVGSPSGVAPPIAAYTSAMKPLNAS